MDQYKSKKQQIADLCDALEFPVYFPQDIELHDQKIVMMRNDGFVCEYTFNVRPKLINSDSMIELETDLQVTQYKAGELANLNNSF